MSEFAYCAVVVSIFCIYCTSNGFIIFSRALLKVRAIGMLLACVTMKSIQEETSETQFGFRIIKLIMFNFLCVKAEIKAMKVNEIISFLLRMVKCINRAF